MGIITDDPSNRYGYVPKSSRAAASPYGVYAVPVRRKDESFVDFMLFDDADFTKIPGIEEVFESIFE